MSSPPSARLCCQRGICRACSCAPRLTSLSASCCFSAWLCLRAGSAPVPHPSGLPGRGVLAPSGIRSLLFVSRALWEVLGDPGQAPPLPPHLSGNRAPARQVPFFASGDCSSFSKIRLSLLAPFQISQNPPPVKIRMGSTL